MSGVIIQELIPRWKGYNSPFARYYPTVDLTFNLKLNPFLDGLSNKFGTRIHEKTLPFLRDFHEITHRFTMTTPIGAYVTKLEIQGNVLMQLACELKNSQPNLMPAIKDELLIRQIAINRLMTEWQPLQEAWALVFVEYLTKQQKELFILMGEGSGKLPEEKSLVQEYNPEIRIDQITKVFETCLSLLSMSFGYGTKKYTFENGSVKKIGRASCRERV